MPRAFFKTAFATAGALAGFVATAILLANSDSARAEIAEVPLPPYALWCATLKFDNADKFATPDAQHEAFQNAASVLARAAKTLGLERIGVPFVRSFSQEEMTTPGPIKVQFCAVVATDQAPAPQSPPPQSPTNQAPTDPPVVAETVRDAKVFVEVCRSAEADACEQRIRAKLAGEPWKLDDDAIDALTWRTAPVRDASAAAPDIAAALTDPAKYGIATADAELRPPRLEDLPFVVVAVIRP